MVVARRSGLVVSPVVARYVVVSGHVSMMIMLAQLPAARLPSPIRMRGKVQFSAGMRHTLSVEGRPEAAMRSAVPQLIWDSSAPP